MTMTTRAGAETFGTTTGHEEEVEPGVERPGIGRQGPGGGPVQDAQRVPRRRRPFVLVELALLSVAYVLYATIRDRQGEDTSRAAFGRALANANRVIRLEQRLGWYHELGLQRWLLADHNVIKVFNVLYATAHITVTAAVLIWLFVWQPDRYRRARTALLLGTAVALLLFWAFPTAPPRLLVNGGFTDTLGKVGGLWSFRTPAIEHIADPYAAMPSLHLAWATWCTLARRPGPRSDGRPRAARMSSAWR
ncbi:MAG: phosphatase PAP2 family protein [Acidimicrobiales bacterium]